MGRWAAGMCACTCVILYGAAARAAEELTFAPAPEWVEELALSDLAETEADASGVTSLLWDEQYRFGPDIDDAYVRTITRIDTPQGLMGVTSVGTQWRPDTQTVTVHRVHLIRDGEIIDLVEAGQDFIVLRRETSLEYAALDGALTAAMQPEGLQVGDVLDFAYTVSGPDPVLQGHSQLATGAPLAPVSRFRINAEWNEDADMRWRVSEEFGDAEERRDGDVISLSVDLEDIEPFEGAAGAPMRFQVGPLLEASEFRSWQDVSTLLAPLFREAAELPLDSPLHAEIERIRAEHSDPQAQAAAALRLVQDQVRYLLLAMGDGGLVPASADQTWARRFGDCKGKTALLLALLHGLGIEAEPVAVSSILGDWLPERLPMVAAFDHVIVRATIEGEVYWLDGTRTGDRRLEDIQPALFHWGLPLTESGGDLVEILPPPQTLAVSETEEIHDFSAGLRAPGAIAGTITLRGDTATVMQQLASVGTATELRDLYRSSWAYYFPSGEFETLEGEYEDESGVFTISVNGTENGVWDDNQYRSGAADLLFADPDPLNEIDADRPETVIMAYPGHSLIREIVVLPHGGEGFTVEGEEISIVLPGAELERTVSMRDGVVTIETSIVTLKPEITAQELAEYRAATTEARESPVRIVAPADYAPTDEDLVQTAADPGSGAQVARGYQLMAEGKIEEALAAFDDAVNQAPDNASVLAGRAIAHLSMDNIELAERDLERARDIDPGSPAIAMAEANLASVRGDDDAELEAMNALVESSPDAVFPLLSRAQYHRQRGQNELALADATEATRIDPKDPAPYQLRANIYGNMNQRYKALGEAEALAAANPDDAYAQMIVGAIYAGYDDLAAADMAFERSLEIEPTVGAYLTRAAYRRAADVDGRREDAEAALALEPDSAEARQLLAETLMESGDYSEAIPLLDAIIQESPTDYQALTARGIAYLKAGDGVRAETDFQAIYGLDDPWLLNNLCWEKAIAQVALDSALQDCEAALEAQPDAAAIIDSRAMVYLQMARFEDAVADYDRALELSPTMSSSLFGRGIAKRRLGLAEAGDADIAAARAITPSIEDDYLRYGLTP